MVVLIICAWILVVLAVVSLCAAAQAGDRRHAVALAEPEYELPHPAALAQHGEEDALVASQPGAALERTAA